jgi:hypothetical protein
MNYKLLESEAVLFMHLVLHVLKGTQNIHSELFEGLSNLMKILRKTFLSCKDKESETLIGK